LTMTVPGMARIHLNVVMSTEETFPPKGIRRVQHAVLVRATVLASTSTCSGCRDVSG
jgi:hypothetical protein